MKSIKEKAIEVFPRHCNATTDYSNFKKRIGFNSGANYVLECLERAIESNESTFVYSREKYIKVQVLNELIEKLKVK